MQIGETISKLRNEKHMTQQELADIVGVGRSYIAQVERGSKIPSVLLGNEIAKALGCQIGVLVNE